MFPVDDGLRSDAGGLMFGRGDGYLKMDSVGDMLEMLEIREKLEMPDTLDDTEFVRLCVRSKLGWMNAAGDGRGSGRLEITSSASFSF